MRNDKNLGSLNLANPVETGITSTVVFTFPFESEISAYKSIDKNHSRPVPLSKYASCLSRQQFRD